jgi:AAA15 family ATPase/GTPase
MYYFGRYENIKIGGGKMIVMDLKVDNFYAFKNFHINMSYPKKIVDSNIANENLTDRSNFRYKKVNIIMGSNATGKTSLGKMLMTIFNFISNKNIENIKKIICDKSKKAYFSIDIVPNDFELYRIESEILPYKEDEYSNSNIRVSVNKVKINKNDSYEKCIKRFPEKTLANDVIYMNELEKISVSGWFFVYPTENLKMDFDKDMDNYLEILRHTLKALDPSIEKINKLKGVENSYVIRTKNNELIVQDGEIVKESFLSSGTKSGLDIADMIASIKNGINGFYYCDEKFSYVHSDIEKAFLSVMINSLMDDDQLFITTHNTDVLDLDLPKHTFVFLKKDISDVVQPIKCVSASDYLKRNTDSLRNAIDNDLFSVAPTLDLIYKLNDL